MNRNRERKRNFMIKNLKKKKKGFIIIKILEYNSYNIV